MSNGSGLFSDQSARLPHLVDGKGGMGGEIDDLRKDVARVLAALAAFTVDEFTDPVAADTDAVLASVASQDVEASYSSTDLVGGGPVVLDPPRNLTLTCDDSAATWQDNLTATGIDINGDAITEAIAFTNNTTTAGVKAFARVDSLVADAQVDANGNWSVGFGDVLGLSKPIKERAGLSSLLREIEDGSVVATGTVVDATTSPPNGTYEPATVPDAGTSYAVYYEYDPTA